MTVFTRFTTLLLALAAVSAVPVAHAQQATEHEVVEESVAPVLSVEQLDGLLAPIALYPDTLLSHILIAAGYPLEVVQARRFQEANSHLDDEEMLEAVQDQDWSPSIKALMPFPDVLKRLDQELNWTQALGEAFIANEALVMERVQYLRRQAKDNGYLASNHQVVVEEEPQVIRIESVQREIIYVPQYDTRVVYGHWWHPHPPVYWPAYDGWTSVYWGPAVWVRPTFYFSTFHWHQRHVVVNYPVYDHRISYYHYPTTQVIIQSGQRWHHNPHHRRGVHYKVINREVHTGNVVVRNQNQGQRAINKESSSASVLSNGAARPATINRQNNSLDDAPYQKKVANLQPLSPKSAGPDPVRTKNGYSDAGKTRSDIISQSALPKQQVQVNRPKPVQPVTPAKVITQPTTNNPVKTYSVQPNLSQSRVVAPVPMQEMTVPSRSIAPPPVVQSYKRTDVHSGGNTVVRSPSTDRSSVQYRDARPTNKQHKEH
ncbi:DUF3300 domain-containing protein [Aliiglaciecola sp. CAU 1673]|uniref:DUF3300 domain-containing protein n=1 Tax=Aliiglaciecola sp. CAU 1673 TaxID=3032595 RepID=UPI0023D9DFA0|nr:DUF3300 domain-containing protein [Aliiglaciecola sp. CAU 1673]MDF2177337.1 DUF3300 domain-containing protein [Aliiglaciecola sp. CAU 1673]